MRNLIICTLTMLALGLWSAAAQASPARAGAPESTAASPAPGPTPAAASSAQQPASNPKKLSVIVVTAQRHPIPIYDTSRHTWIITSADLERLGALTAADALRFVPGAVVQQYGTYGSLSTVALRGASSSQTLVLINGHPANEADTGVFDFSSLPASVIDRIEIVQGGASTLYGSSAVGGVINILTHRPVSAGNLNLYAQVGYQGEYARGLGFTFGATDILARVDAQTVSARNSFSYPAFGDLYPAGTRSNSDAKSEDTAVNLSGHLGVVAADALLQNDASAIGAPGSVFFASALARQQRVYQRMNLDFGVPLARGDVGLQLSSDGRRLHFYDPTQPFAFDTQANGSTRGAALRATTAVGRMQVVTAGYDASSAVSTFDFAFEGAPHLGPPVACEGITLNRPCVARDTTNAWYVQDELHAPDARLAVSLGVRTQRSQGTKPVSVPSAGVILRLTDSVDVLTNYARAFRSPNLDERFYPGFGDPTLQPEYAATFDAGVRAHGDRSEFVAAYFGQDTSNLIINVPIDAFGDVKPFNVSRARVRGLESSLTSDVGTFAHAYVGYTNFLRAQDFTPQFSGNRLLYRPTATAAAAAWISRGSWSYGIDSTFVGRRYANEANSSSMKAYVVTGVHVKKKISRRLALTVRVENIANNHHAEDVLGYPVVGSAFSIRLSTR